MNLNFESDLSLKHLQVELARIDLRIQGEVRRWQLAGQDPADTFRGLYVSEAETIALLNRPFGVDWGQLVALDPAESQALAEAEAKLAGERQSLLETARREGQALRLHVLALAFCLDRFELDAFLICLAPTLDLRYERFYGYLQDDVTRKRPSVNLIFNLLCESASERLYALSRFADDAPLFVNHLLIRSEEAGQPLLSQPLAIDEAIVAWLLGQYQPHAELGQYATLRQPQEAEDDQLLAAGVWTNLEHIIAGQPLFVFFGPDQTSQRAAARLLAAQQGRYLLQVDLAALVKQDMSPLQVLKLALRDARLTGAIPYLTGWDACLIEGNVSPDLLGVLCAYTYL